MKFQLPCKNIGINIIRLGCFILATDIFMLQAVYQNNMSFLLALFVLNVTVYTVFFSILFDTNNVLNKIALYKYIKNNKLSQPYKFHLGDLKFTLGDFVCYVDFNLRRLFMVDNNNKIVIHSGVPTVFDHILNHQCLLLIEKNILENAYEKDNCQK